MTKEELKQHDGKEGRKAYIAYNGVVYDVSESKMWKNGSHMRQHEAGIDLTDQLANAPHGEAVFSRFEAVDMLDDGDTTESLKQSAKTDDTKQKLRDLYAKLHPHPILIHFPMGLFMFAAAMQLLFLVYGVKSFEQAAFYSLIGGTVTMPPTAVAGVFSWWVNYNTVFNRIFTVKIVFTILLTIAGTAEIVVRFMNPDIAHMDSNGMMIYNAFIFLNVPMLGMIGYHGGKLTWPDSI